MKLIHWTFRDLHLPMLELEDGKLYCTSRVLCLALGLKDYQLRDVLRRHSDRLTPDTIAKTHASKFFDAHRTDFGMQRVRGDAHLWPLEEALGVAFHVHTDTAWEFHKSAIRLVVEQATKYSVTQAEHMALEARLESRIDGITSLLTGTLRFPVFTRSTQLPD